MNIEIIKFYPMEKDERKDILKGNLHIAFLDIGFDIRGIRINKKGKSWFLMLPGAKGIDKTTKKPVFFPYLSFRDREKQKNLIREIKELAIPYIESLLRDTTNPLVFPPPRKKPVRKKSPAGHKKPYATNKVIPRSPRAPMPMSGWVDPPKKSTFARKNSAFR